MLNRLRHSLTFAMGMTLGAITLLALCSMVATIYLTETAQGDAQAINRAGSLRMQAWRLLAVASQVEQPRWQQLLEDMDGTYARIADTGLFARPQAPQTRRLRELQRQWQQLLRPALRQPARVDTAIAQRIATHVSQLDGLVGLMQQAAEQRLQRLKWLQITFLLLTLPILAYGGYQVFRHVLPPLRHLLSVVEALRQGDFTARSHYRRDDEIGLLSATVDDMAEQLALVYRGLENQVQDKSYRLQESHLALRLLYANARYLASTAPRDIDYEHALAPFATLLAPARLRLETAEDSSEEDPHALYFPLQEAGTRYATLIVTLPDAESLPQWKRQICETIADHLSAAMVLQARSRQQRRLDLMDERAVIARELHDSLAQSLSYLNIQAMRLERQLQTHLATDEADPRIATVLAELRQGIDHAYRQLRELLVTFRLRLTEQGLGSAVSAAVAEFAARGKLTIEEHVALEDDLLAPDEELHVVQILREALANVVQHARASHVRLELRKSDAYVTMRIEDNGVGLPAELNRPQHYGTIIMQERAHSLAGTLHFSSSSLGGARIDLSFIPRGMQHDI
ncbi:two-component system sensor histidine kinase NarX [Halomonas shantousis]